MDPIHLRVDGFGATAGGIVQFVFYAVAGMAWVVPVRYLILWMNTPGRKDKENGEAA